MYSCSLPCFQSHKNACSAQIPTRITPSVDGSHPEDLTPMTKGALMDDPRLLQLLTQHPTLRSRLRMISDEPPRRQHNGYRDRGNQIPISAGGGQGQPEISSKRRIAHATRVLEKELKSPSSEDNGLAAFVALVTEYNTSSTTQ